ncbi:MAG: DUF6475 domain-containing protein [Pseudomonadota bacterium]
MQVDEFQSFSELLIDVLSFYGKDVSKFQVGVYWEVLKRYDLASVRSAFSQHAGDPDQGQFAPKPADLVRLIEGSGQDRAQMAWGKVQKALSRVGAYRSVVFDDPAIHAALADMGSWPELCRTNADDLQFRAREFEQRYRGYARRQNFNYPKKLIGIVGSENGRDGYEHDEPMLIGNSQLALTVMRNGGGEKSEAVLLSEFVPEDPKLLKAASE